MQIKENHKNALMGITIWALIIVIEALIALYEVRAFNLRPGFWHLFTHRMLLPTLPFTVLYFIHDLIIAPILIKGRKTALYIICAACALGLFAVFELNFDRPASPRKPMPPMEGHMAPPQKPSGEDPYPDNPHPADPEIFKILLALMIMGVNLGSKYSLYYSSEKRRIENLEKENLKFRLECLRYQINPHFFMNTLHNIHALVDISPEKAKESIVELSRLMRHVLYDSNNATVDLNKETDFLQHYIYLMRLRYTDSVKITCDFPEKPVNAQVPPLLMSTIVENAFKHGVSYNCESFISISIAIENRKVIFRCTNSIPADRKTDSGGVGLENISKRLALLYEDSFLMHIDSRDGKYDVLIVIPSEPVNQITDEQKI